MIHLFLRLQRDLKPQNLLLMAPLREDSQSMRPPTLKIADFGFARALGPQLMAETLCGSPLYMAPEILLSQKYDAKADLWSVGAILYEMLSGHPPYTGANQVVLLRNIREREAKLADTIASELTPACTSLVHSLLKRHAVERLSFEEFFRHPFIAGAFEPVVGFKGTALHTFGSEKPSFDGTSAPTPLPVGQLTAQLHTRGPRLVSMQRPTVVQPHPCMLGRSQNSAADDEKDPQGEDDDYVLVTASATELPQNTFETKDPQVGGKNAQRDASRGGELQEAFLLHASVTAAPANREGGTTLDRTVPWQASSRRQFFAHVAGILCSSNIEEAVRQDRTESVDNLKHGSTSDLATELSFHLAALQLYAYALEGRPRLPITGVRGSMHSSNESADDGLVDGHAIHDSVIAAMERSDALVAAVQAKASKQAVLPNPWDACYHAALKWAEEAATEEILGNYQRGEALYARAGAVLHFLGAETASLPPNHVLMFCSSTVGKDERQMKQLRRCTAAIAVRWAVCAALSVQNCHTLL